VASKNSTLSTKAGSGSRPGGSGAPAGGGAGGKGKIVPVKAGSGFRNIANNSGGAARRAVGGK
jgi:hypothetical protein